MQLTTRAQLLISSARENGDWISWVRASLVMTFCLLKCVHSFLPMSRIVLESVMISWSSVCLRGTSARRRPNQDDQMHERPFGRQVSGRSHCGCCGREAFTACSP